MAGMHALNVCSTIKGIAAGMSLDAHPVPTNAVIIVRNVGAYFEIGVPTWQAMNKRCA